jgi:hypothetical protein
MEFSTFAAMLSGADPSTLQRSLVVRHQQTWRLREYYLYSSSSSDPLSDGDPLRAWLPVEATFESSPNGELSVWDPITGLYVTYNSKDSNVRGEGEGGEVKDVLITGEGHSAWGQFNLYGRVRPSDGFFCVSKEYVRPILSLNVSSNIDKVADGWRPGCMDIPWTYCRRRREWSSRREMEGYDEPNRGAWI